uniref:Uncharacterized protein n=1 Tax=Tanacetum cinerariifolium TaxID=118510 RepID=A0A6L2JIR2_TANCI|nr:hypothetical protein [Tanacetum cinerariifolium]
MPLAIMISMIIQMIILKGGGNSKKQKSTFSSMSANDKTSSNQTSSSKTTDVYKPRSYASQPPIPTYDDTWSMVPEINDGVDISEEADTKFIAEIQEDDLEELLKRWIDEVIVKRNNDKFYTFAESDFKYLNKNDIEDIIKKDPLYIIIDVSFVGIVYENNKKEKRAMDINELHKFSDATLRMVLRKISVINMEAKHEIVKISLSEIDKELMALLEEEIEEMLKYRLHMQRWESFVNGGQIANYMVCPE